MCEEQHTVHRVAGAEIKIAGGPVRWERVNSDRIDQHWSGLVSRNPALWDGRIHLAVGGRVDNGIFRAVCHGARFATLLCWRDQGYEPSGFRTLFGDVILVTTDGATLLGRMGPETANAGRLYFPGGSFDENDERDRRLDVEGGIARECLEETGLGQPDLIWDSDFIVYEDPVRIAFGRVARLPWTAKESSRRIRSNMAGSKDPELSDIVVVRSVADATEAGAEPYALRLCEWLFSGGRH